MVSPAALLFHTKRTSKPSKHFIFVFFEVLEGLRGLISWDPSSQIRGYGQQDLLHDLGMKRFQGIKWDHNFTRASLVDSMTPFAPHPFKTRLQ